MRILFMSLAAGFILLAPANDVRGQSSQGQVSEIRIRGNRTITDAYIRRQIENVRLGQPAEVKEIQKDVDNIKLTGKFIDVFATTEKQDGQVVVTFNVREKPTVASITFLGAKKIKAKDLLDALDFGQGDALDDFRVRAGIDAIAEAYHEKGYSEVSVSVDEEALKTGEVIYQITEGPRVRVRKVRFEGNGAFGASRLTGQTETKPYMWIFRQGRYSEKQIVEDIVSLRKFYQQEGFLDIQVGRRLEFSPDRRDLTVIFVIQEGPQYRVGTIAVEGNSHFTDEQVASSSETQLSGGDILNLARLEADRQAVLDRYHQAGFINAAVDIEYTYTDTPETADLRIKVTENRSYKIGRILVKGNQQTQDRVIRRTLDFFPGDTFDLIKIRKRQKRLKQSMLFREVTISPTGDEPDVRDVRIQVEEGSPGRLLVGAGVSSNSGLVGNINLETWNFDITDWPRSWGELFRNQAFRGAGQTLKLSLRPGSEMTQARIDFREPYLFDRDLSLGLGAYVFERGRDGYEERRAGTYVSLGKRFKEIYAFETALRFEGIGVRDVDEFWIIWPILKNSPQDIVDAEGSNFLTSVKLSLVRDDTDSYFAPTEGTRSEVSWEQTGVLGGNFSFAKIIGQFTYYRPLRTDVFDRKTVWASNVVLGYIAGDAPVFERFYGGGIGSIRGFDFRGISPRQDPEETAVGGEFELFFSNELSFPMVGKNLRGVLFLDMGTVEENVSITELRASVGFGIRLEVGFLGPIPMSFDFAFPISKNSEDETQVFSFSLGAMFR